MITLNPVALVATDAVNGTASQEVASMVKIKLCKPVCSTASIQPIPSVQYSIKDVNTIGTTTFVVLKAEGNLSYVPNGCKACLTKIQSFAEETTLVFSNSESTAAPTVSITQGQSWGTLTDVSESCVLATGYELTTDVTVNAVYA